MGEDSQRGHEITAMGKVFTRRGISALGQKYELKSEFN